MSDSIFIQHRFTTIGPDNIPLTDAIILPIAEYNALTPSQIETMKEERLTTFVERIKNPPKIEEPPKEDQLQEVEEQLKQLTAQKELLTAEIAAADLSVAPLK